MVYDCVAIPVRTWSLVGWRVADGHVGFHSCLPGILILNILNIMYYLVYSKVIPKGHTMADRDTCVSRGRHFHELIGPRTYEGVLEWLLFREGPLFISWTCAPSIPRSHLDVGLMVIWSKCHLPVVGSCDEA